MKPTDYDRIAEALGISVSEARALETEQRRWNEFVAKKAGGAAMAAAPGMVSGFR